MRFSRELSVGVWASSALLAQCRESWHLEEEPEKAPAAGSGVSKESAGGFMIDSAGEGEEQAGAGVRRVRSTRRRQDAPKLPKRDKSGSTLGRTFTTAEGKVFRPSLFVTLTLPSYGRVRDGLPVDPDGYDYASAARDALHFSNGTVVFNVFDGTDKRAEIQLYRDPSALWDLAIPHRGYRPA